MYFVWIIWCFSSALMVQFEQCKDIFIVFKRQCQCFWPDALYLGWLCVVNYICLNQKSLSLSLNVRIQFCVSISKAHSDVLNHFCHVVVWMYLFLVMLCCILCFLRDVWMCVDSDWIVVFTLNSVWLRTESEWFSDPFFWLLNTTSC